LSTSATFWVKLTSSIAGSGGTLTIYMAFLSATTDFDGTRAGEAPTLSRTYGQYDNGASVFTLYDNFAGTSLNSKWVMQASAGGTITVNNGINFSVASGTDYAYIHTPSTMAYPLVLESDILSATGTAPYGAPNLLVGFSLGTSLGNNYANGTPCSQPYPGYDYDMWENYVEIDYNDATNCLSNVYIGGVSFTPGIWSFTWYATGAEAGTDGVHSLAWNDARNTIGNYYPYTGILANNAGTFQAQWTRARITPPNDVAPSVTFGSFTVGTILTFTNSGSSSLLANLMVVTSSNTARLNNLTLSFQNPYSQQVVLGNGVPNIDSGPPVTLAASATIAIAVGVTVNSGGTTTVNLALRIQSPPSPGATSVYCFDVISLTVS
jgi:hypothetical protein